MAKRALAYKRLLLVAILAAGLILVALAAACGGTEGATDSATAVPATSATIAPTTTPAPTAEPMPEPTPGPAAPEFAGITRWLNSQPLTMAGLRGQVVLVDFWTYTCINCIRTLPYLRDWYSKYAGNGLVMVGVHSPEFEFEKREEGVREAIVRESVAWPVAMDNDFKTWRAYENRYWPHKFLIDHNGRVIYDHIGEGAYDVTEEMIRKALTNAGYEVSGITVGGTIETRGPRTRTTRELYAGLGWSGGEYLGNELLRGDDEALYQDDGAREDGRFYVNGAWEFDSESIRHSRVTGSFEDYVAIQYKAASVNAVIRPESDSPFPVVAILDGGPIPAGLRGDDIMVDESGRTYFLADDARLYNVVRGPTVSTHDLELRVDSDGFVLYSYTFGD